VVDRVRAGQTRLLVQHSLGAGKSLAALAAAAAAGRPYTAVVPAALRENLKKEQAKFLAADAPPGDVVSYTALGKTDGTLVNPDTLIADEAQRLRSPDAAQTKAFLAAAGRARTVLLLSGTPVVNDPADFAPLYQALTGERTTAEGFRGRFVAPARTSETWLGRLFRGPDRPETLRNTDELEKALAGHVDFHRPAAPGVRLNEVTVPVEMGGHQAALYDRMYARLPNPLRRRLERGLGFPEADLKRMTAFLAGPREVGLSTRPFDADKNPLAAADHSPKLRAALARLTERLKDPAAKALVFSNFVGAGLEPYAAALARDHIPAAVFHGGLTDPQRKALVDDYNRDKLRVALLGPSGTEGLSFKGTRLVQLLDPHWNEARGNQSVGRGVRFDSHTHLSPDDREVTVERYLARRPPAGGFLARLLGAEARPAADDHLTTLAARKERLNREFLQVLERVGSAPPPALPPAPRPAG
jgi:superfamily II DNA or RNA helicase